MSSPSLVKLGPRTPENFCKRATPLKVYSESVLNRQ